MRRVLYDVIVAVFFCALVGVPSTIIGTAGSRLGCFDSAPWWQWAAVPALVLLFLPLMLATGAGIRLCLPRVRAGRYAFPSHQHALVWLLHFGLQRLMYLPVWRHLIFAFSSLRWGLLRALGARVAFDVDMSSDVLVGDPSLVEVGAGTMIGAGCALSGHVIEQGSLVLAPIRIGRGVEVGGGTVVGPGVEIGDQAVVGPDCQLGTGASVGASAFLGAACHLAPGVRIGAHAVLGHRVDIGPDVVVGARAVVASGTQMPRGTVVPEGARVPADPRDADVDA